MKLRILSAVVAVVVLAAATVGGFMIAAPNEARAVAAETPPALPAVIYDQQDVRTDATGRVLLDFRTGDRVQSCLAGAARYVGIVPARNITNPGNGPISVQAVQHTDCNVLLRIFNDSDDPIGGAVIRLTYTASAVTTLGGEGGEPASEPEPEPTPDPDPEPGPSLLKNQGGAALPQGVTALGDVEPGQYSGVVPAGTLCYFALLESTDTSNGVLGTPQLTFPTADENFIATVPEDANGEADGVQVDLDGEGGDEPVTVRFVHVDCAAG